MVQHTAADDEIIVIICVQNKSPRIRQDGEADCDHITTEIFARLHVSDVHRLRQAKGKRNSMHVHWDYFTLLCCKSPRVVNREWGGMELRRPFPNRYTSSFLLHKNGSLQANERTRSAGVYLWSTVGKVRLTCHADNKNIIGTVNRTQEGDRAMHLKI